MSDQEDVEDVLMEDEHVNNNYNDTGVVETVSPSTSTPAPATVVNDTNGDESMAMEMGMEYAAIGLDGTAIPVEVMVQQEETQIVNGIDVNFLTSMVQFCRNAGLKDTEKMLAKEVGFTIAGEEPEEEEQMLMEDEENYQDTPIDKRQKVLYGVREETSSTGDKKKKKELKDAKKKDTNAPAPDRIPLPYLPDFVLEERRVASNAKQKGKITIDNAPSVCIFNACNTNGGLSSAEISENSALFALGLNDGSVQVRTLSDECMKQVKHSTKLESALEDDLDVDIYEEFSADSKPQKASFTGHSAAVTSTCFSPDRRVLLTSSLDGTSRLWGVELRRGLVVYRHPCAVYQTRLSNRGLYFVSSCADQSVHLWSTERIHPIRLFTGSFGATHALDFHPNCNYVIGGSNDGNVRMWDTLSAGCVRLFSGHKGGLRGVKTSPDGRYIVSFSEDGMLSLWDIGQQKLAASQQLEPCASKVPISFMRDSSGFAIGNPRWGLSFFSIDSVIAGDLNEPKIDPPGFLIHQYYTERTPVVAIDFSKRNLVFCVGALNQ